MSVQLVLIGLDGATFTVLDPLMAQGEMPHLKSLADGGVRAPLRSIVPPLTPPAWTSLLTGRRPGHHGIFDFFQLEAPGSRRIRLATSHDIRCETLAEMLNRHGLRATVLNFPAHFPPPALDGYVIAGWMPWRQLRLGCHPAHLYDQLKMLPDFNPRELAMDMALEAKATEGCQEDEYAAWVELHIRREHQWLAVVRHLMQTDPTELIAVLLDGPDKVQHLCWRFLDPELWPAHPTLEEQRIRDLCLEYFRQLDQVIGQIVEMAGPEATVIIASDHGFGATTEVFHVNAWLEQAGYLAWSEEARLGNIGDGILGMGHLSRHTEWLDWEHTCAYAATPTSNGIHIVTADHNGRLGVQPEEYTRFRAELMEALYSLVDPLTGEAVVSRIWTREEAFPGVAADLAPDLTLTLRDGGLVSILPSVQVLKPRPKPVGTHRPLGIFLAKGPGIRRGVVLPEQSILDVAPLTLYRLGLGIPEELEGRVPLEIHEPAFQTRTPVRVESAAGRPSPLSSREAVEGVYDEEAEEVMLARLKALGYLE
jgi:predicted AlkP superfamily phosphohydrolase/phosphomutase